MSFAFGVQPDEGLAGGDEVAVLDDPLDDGAAVRGDDRRRAAQVGDLADDRCRRVSAMSMPTPSAWWNVPFEGETSIRQVGVESMGEASPCLSANARASSSWSGVFSANVSTPFICRLAMPTRVPAGGISMMPVTPRSSIVCMQRSQRTGLLTWVTSRLRVSWPLCTICPSRLEISRVRVSWVEIARASWASTSTAGRMCSVWKAPATLSGIRRAFSGPSSASLASCSIVPAATIWPAPLSLAGVSPCSASLASTSSRSPPRTAVMPVGVAAEAVGHRVAALAHEHHRLLGGHHAGTDGGGDLADAVPGDARRRGRRRRPGAG